MAAPWIRHASAVLAIIEGRYPGPLYGNNSHAMFQFFRNFFQSKIGLGITFAFLGLIAFAFASSDVANTATFGGVAGGDRVAVVGDRKVSTAELSRATTNAAEQLREQNPTLTMQDFVREGGLDQTLDQLLDRYAIGEYARELGLRAGDNLVNSEIVSIPQFRGIGGEFDQAAYRSALQRVGLTDAIFRSDVSDGLLAQQILGTTTANASIPAKMARQYAALFRERRIGQIAFLPSAAFIPSANPSDTQLQTFYNANRSKYVRPERRVIRYAEFGSDAVASRIEPTNAEIAQYYRDNAAEFAAREERRYTQVIAASQSAAQAIADAVESGQSLTQAAQAAGLRASTLGPMTRAELTSETSKAVADAFFAANEGTATKPVRGSLGWYVANINDVTSVAGRSLAQARSEIVETVREQKRVTLLSDLSEEVEMSLSDGIALTEVAEDLGLELKTTRAVLPSGAIYATQGEQVDPVLELTLETAFQMEESEPQLAEIERGEKFVIFEVTQITESAAAPLAQIKDRLAADWKVIEGQKAARKAADAILAKLAKDDTLNAALRSTQSGLPPAQSINMTRQEIAQLGDQRVPPPLALLFAMVEGSEKKLEGENASGFYVVALDTIEPGVLAANDPLVAQAQRQLGEAIGQEYQLQFVAAMRAAQGAEINDPAVDAVRKQLLGEN